MVSYVLSAFQITRVVSNLKISTQLRPKKTLTPWYIITGSERLNVRKKIALNYVVTNNICFFLGDDILIYQDKENPDRTFIIEITEDGKYLVMFIIKDFARVSVLYFLSTYYSYIVPEKSLMDCWLRHEQHWPEHQMDKISRRIHRRIWHVCI